MHNPMDLTGRTVLVTGASSGLGRAVCALVSQLGGRVILVARNTERLEETRSLMVAGQHLVVPFDVTDVDAIPKWMKQLASETGPMSGLVHCAGVHRTLPLRVVKQSMVDELMGVNFSAAVALTKGLRQRGVRAEQSSVVYISSIAALAGNLGNAVYSATKGALVAMCRSLAMELADEGIRVNCVAPGHVPTEMAAKAEQLLSESQIKAIEDMHPLGVGKPDDVANAVAFLLADSGRWITGSNLVVDGGYTAH